MQELENNLFFWQKLDTLILSSGFTIDRPKGSHHYKFTNLIYPVNYGFLTDTSGADQPPIDVYVGSRSERKAQAIVVTCDILKKDCVVKLITGCTEEEIQTILQFLNQTAFQKAILVRRGHQTPAWANAD